MDKQEEVVVTKVQKLDADFVALCDRIDNSIEEVHLRGVKFVKDGEGIKIGGKTLSDRATRNLGKWLSVPVSLLKELSEPVLNSTLEEQMVRRDLNLFRVGFNPADPEEIIFIQPYGLPYIQYVDVFGKVDKQIEYVKGNPVSDDVLRVMIRGGTISPQGEDLVVGQQVKISNITVCKPTSVMLLFKLICANGLVSERLSQEYEIEAKNATGELIAEIVTARSGDLKAFAQEMEEFVEASIKYPVDATVETVMDDMDASRLVPKTVTKQARVTGEQIKKKELNLQRVGIVNLETLWDYTNLMTWQLQAMTSFSARENAEKGVFDWASMKLTGIGG